MNAMSTPMGREAELHGVHYRIGRLDIFDQFDVSRKVGPFAPALVPVFQAFARFERAAAMAAADAAREPAEQPASADSPEAAPATTVAPTAERWVFEDIVVSAKPFLDSLAAMPREDSRFVISTCLSVVRRQQGSNWSPVFNRDAGVVMFDDLDLSTVAPLVVKVIQDNLGPFFFGWLTAQTSKPPKAAA